MKFVMVLLSCLTISPVFGQWFLAADLSDLSFITIKNEHFAEQHSFKQFSGHVTDGQVSITIKLSSVDTNIAIRNQRMQEHLFSVNKYPEASFRARLNNEDLTSLKAGQSKRLKIKGEIDLHGLRQPVEIKVLVSKLLTGTLQVTSLQPLLIRAEDFSLVAGINKLQQLAGLESISYTVPLSFSLTFVQR